MRWRLRALCIANSDLRRFFFFHYFRYTYTDIQPPHRMKPAAEWAYNSYKPSNYAVNRDVNRLLLFSNRTRQLEKYRRKQKLNLFFPFFILIISKEKTVGEDKNLLSDSSETITPEIRFMIRDYTIIINCVIHADQIIRFGYWLTSGISQGRTWLRTLPSHFLFRRHVFGKKTWSNR